MLVGQSQNRGAYTKIPNIAYGVTALVTIAGVVVELIGGPVPLVFALTSLALVGLAWVSGRRPRALATTQAPKSEASPRPPSATPPS
jgi:hypothetical protein